MGAGYRTDSLDWNEAGAGVNIMSELKWDHLEITQISAAVKLDLPSDWNLRSMLSYGSINSGSNQDSDYNGNDRTLEYSRSNNKGGGDVSDASIGLGRTLRLSKFSDEVALSVTPLAGLSRHRQNLTMTDGFQTLPGSFAGAFYGLNNSYNTQWQSQWIGLDTRLEWGRDWTVSANMEYHWADYSARANWNLRHMNFVHTAKGQGILLAAGANYHVSKHWDVLFSGQIQRWSTGAGIDQTNYSDGSVAYYRLNGVNWNSSAFSLGMAYRL